MRGSWRDRNRFQRSSVDFISLTCRTKKCAGQRTRCKPITLAMLLGHIVQGSTLCSRSKKTSALTGSTLLWALWARYMSWGKEFHREKLQNDLLFENSPRQ